MAGLPRCRGCDEPLSAQNDSEAHIIPNALGGRVKPKGIICRTCNSELDKVADNALIRAFRDWPTLLDIPRDRGSNPAKVIETLSGRRVRLKPDGSMTAIDIIYSATQIPDGHELKIGAGDIKTIRNLLKKAAKNYPVLDPKVAEQAARVVSIEDDDPLHMQFDFGTKAVFGGVLTATWLYLIHVTGHAFMDWDQLLQSISKMQETGGTFRYLTDGLPGLDGPNIDLGHKIIVRSIPSTGELIAYVEILGILKIGGIFARSLHPPAAALEHIYVYDLTSETDRSAEFSVNAAVFEAQDWSSTGLGPDRADQLRAHFLDAANILIEHYRRRFNEAGLPA